MPRRVVEEVPQHLRDAPRVRHDPEPLRRLNGYLVPPAAARERRPRPLDDVRELGRRRVDRKRPRADAPGVQQVADQPRHSPGLLRHDAQVLAQLVPVRLARVLKRRLGRAPDRRQRRAQLVAHQLQELRPRALQRLERRQVLERDHHPFHGVGRGADRGGVDQRAHALAPRRGDLHLLGAHDLGVHQIAQPDLAPVAAPADHRVAQRGGGCFRHLDPGQDAPRLPVERERRAVRGVQHRHPDRAGLDEGLEVGPRAPLLAVGAGVGERRGGLLGEQHQHRLVGIGEPALLAAEEEAARSLPPVTHRRCLERPAGHREGRAAERAGPGVEVGQAQRLGQRTKMAEQPEPVRPGLHRPVLLLREARGDEVAGLSRPVRRRDHAVGGAGQRAGARHHLVQHLVEVEARADAQDRRRERRVAPARPVLPWGAVVPRGVVALAHGPISPRGPPDAGSSFRKCDEYGHNRGRKRHVQVIYCARSIPHSASGCAICVRVLSDATISA